MKHTGQAVRREEGYKVGEELHAGIHKYELELNEERLKPLSAAVASDLDVVGVQQKPGPLVVELNTYTCPRRQKLKEVSKKVE